MQNLILQINRFSFLALLWIFIILILRVIRADMNQTVQQTQPKTPLKSSFSLFSRNSTKNPKYLSIISGGKLTGSKITLGNLPILIGRADDCTLVLTDDYISNHHARLIPKSNGWYLEDLSSTNGTFLDRARISGLTRVPVGAQIQLGQTLLELKL